MAFPWDILLGPIFKIIDKVVPDVAERERQKNEIIKLQMQGELAWLDADVKLALGQMDVNKAEAQSGSFFRGGWRPAVGWLCVAGFGYMTVVRPILPWVANLLGADVPPLPAIDTAEIGALLFGMLGLGGMRTAERLKGRA